VVTETYHVPTLRNPSSCNNAVGDYIEFQNLSGYIKEIAMRSTIVRTFDGGDVVIPNSNLVGNQVLNWSYKNFTGKLHLLVGVAYDSDLILVTETLLSCAYMEPSVLYDPPPRVSKWFKRPERCTARSIDRGKSTPNCFNSRSIEKTGLFSKHF
jgi:small-conductance mechanosensitive channel